MGRYVEGEDRTQRRSPAGVLHRVEPVSTDALPLRVLEDPLHCAVLLLRPQRDELWAQAVLRASVM